MLERDNNKLNEKLFWLFHLIFHKQILLFLVDQLTREAYMGFSSFSILAQTKSSTVVASKQKAILNYCLLLDAPTAKKKTKKKKWQHMLLWTEASDSISLD